MDVASLPDEICVLFAAALDATALAVLQQVSQRFATLETSPLWRSLCERRWRDKPRFALVPARERWLNAHMALNWQQRYFFFEQDAKRQTLALSEIADLAWVFNFTPQAGGAGVRSRRRAHFIDDGNVRGSGSLHLESYPPLPYKLQQPEVQPPPSDERAGPAAARAASGWRRPLTLMQHMLQSLLLSPHTREQAPQDLVISNFPPHQVMRLEADWEWMICNDNVTLVSFATEDPASDELPERLAAGDFSSHPVLGPRGF